MARNRRTPLSRDRVLETAMRLADEGGIDSLTMRKLGRALGVEAMSLYNHVANKDDMVDGLVDLVLGEFELPDGEGGWEAAVRRAAISAHEALLRHRWAASLIMSRFRPARMRYMDWLLGCLRDAGFSADATYHAYHALDSHILGFTLWELGHSVDPTEFEAAATTFLRDLRARGYRHLAAHGEQHLERAGRGKEGEGDFEFGLDLILDGLKRIRG